MDESIFAKYRNQSRFSATLLSDSSNLDELANVEAVVRFESTPKTNSAPLPGLALALKKQRFEQGCAERQIAPIQHWPTI